MGAQASRSIPLAGQAAGRRTQKNSSFDGVRFDEAVRRQQLQREDASRREEIARGGLRR